MLAIETFIPAGFREINPDRYGNRVFEQFLSDGRRRRIVHPGRFGDTPVFVGYPHDWTLEGRLVVTRH